MASKVTTLFEDSAKTNALYPRTKVSAVSDGSGNGLDALLNGKQDTLVSGTNIKTIDGQSILGSGNISTSPVLLWTNASPTSQFVAQNVAFSTTGYEWFVVIFAFYTDKTNMRVFGVTTKDDTNDSFVSAVHSSYGSTVYRFYRVTSTGLTTDVGHKNTSNDSKAMVPMYVYGCK